MWTTDNSAPEEYDGSNNINNVLYSDQIQEDISPQPPQSIAAATMSGVTPESTTASLAANVPKKSEQAAQENVPGTFPETPGNEPEAFSVNPIPASSGIGNPISLAPGEKVPDSSTTHSNTVESTVRTDPAGYEQDASAPLSGLSSASNPAMSGRRRQSKVEPDSGLPVEGESVGLTDTGVTIESAVPISSTSGLAGEVPLQSRKQQSASGGDGPVSAVPSVVKNSLSEAHRDPEAAASKVAVEEKKEIEDELRQKVGVDESGGTPAPTTTAATSETAPIAAESTTHSRQLSPRSSSPAEPTVTTGVANARTSEVSGPKGGTTTSSEGPTVTNGPTESKAPETSGPKDTSAATDAATKPSEPKFEPKTEHTASDTAKQANGDQTVRKDYADKSHEEAAAKDQKKKNRASGFFQKLKEKLK